MVLNRSYSPITQSTCWLLDLTTGTTVQELRYDEFGRVLDDTSVGFQPFGYAGGLYDSVTGLTRFGVRDYDPYLGRWLTQDSLGFAAGDTNLYRYVYGSPLSFVDVDGRNPIFVMIMVSVTIGFSLGAVFTYMSIEQQANSDCLGLGDKSISILAGGLAGGAIASFAVIALSVETLTIGVLAVGAIASGAVNVVKDAVVSDSTGLGDYGSFGDITASFMGGVTAFGAGVITGGIMSSAPARISEGASGYLPTAVLSNASELTGNIASSFFTKELGTACSNACYGPVLPPGFSN